MLVYAKERKQFGKPIGEFQGVQFELAEMAVRIEAARLMVYNAARLRDAGQPFVTQAAMAKYYASQIAEEVASKAVEYWAALGLPKIIRSKSSIVTRRLGESMRGQATCSA